MPASILDKYKINTFLGCLLLEAAEEEDEVAEEVEEEEPGPCGQGVRSLRMKMFLWRKLTSKWRA